MDCPVCGYAMGPFDVDCPRCARAGPPRHDPPPPATPPLPEPDARSGIDQLMAGYWWVLIMLFCSPIGVIVALIGLVVCQDAVARRHSVAMLVIPFAVVAAFIAVHFVVVASLAAAVSSSTSP